MIYSEHMGDLVIKNNELQEENQMFKNDLIDLNKYDSIDRTLITKSDKKAIAKQYLWNKLQGPSQRVLSKEAVTEEIFQLRPLPNRSNKVILIINDECS